MTIFVLTEKGKTMTNREKLIDLLCDIPGAEEIADHFIANGVTAPVRCRDCIHWDRDFDWCGKKHTRMFEGDFCSYGEGENDG